MTAFPPRSLGLRLSNHTTKPRIAALLTCHNRRDLTLQSIASLKSQRNHGADVDVVVLDAASSDGTAEAIEAQFEHTTVLRGHADQFWARGMHAGFVYARETGRYDYFLWLNDDTLLDSDALARLLAAQWQLREQHPGPSIVVGATRDPQTGATTYGGIRRSARGSPLRFESVPPHAHNPRPVDTMNGNCVLVPSEVVERIGVIDPRYFHSLADFDYGLRAGSAGCGVWLAQGTVGTCQANTHPSTRRERLRFVFGRRRVRAYEWYTFARRWGGRWWPLLLPAPYVRHAIIALSSHDDEQRPG